MAIGDFHFMLQVASYQLYPGMTRESISTLSTEL